MRFYGNKHVKRIIFFLMLGYIFSPPSYAQKGGASPAQGQGNGTAGGGSTPYFETQMLAYGAVNQLAETITQEVCTNIKAPENPIVIIYDQSSFQNLQAWQSFVASTHMLEKAYGTLLSTDVVSSLLLPPQKPTGASAYIIAPSSLSDIASLISSVSAATAQNGSAFTIQDSTVAVSLAHQFRRTDACKTVDVIYYPLFGSYTSSTHAEDMILDAMDRLNILRNYIQLNVTFSNGNDPRFLLFTDLNNQYDQLLKAASSSFGSGQGGQSGQGQGTQTTQAGGNNAPPAQSSGSSGGGGSQGYPSLLQGAELEELLFRPNTYVLYADVVAAGGTQVDKKNIFTLFTGDWISYSGGLIVNVALIDSSHTSLVFADTLRYRTANEHMRAPRESEHVENTNLGENEESACHEETRLSWWNSEKHASYKCPKKLSVPPNTHAALNPQRVPRLTMIPDLTVIGGSGSTKVSLMLSQPELNDKATVKLQSGSPLVRIDPATVSLAEAEEKEVDLHTSSVSIPTIVKITARCEETITDDSSTPPKKSTPVSTSEFSIKLYSPLFAERTTFTLGDASSVQITLPDVTDQERTFTVSVDNQSVLSVDRKTVKIGAGSNTASFRITAQKVTEPAAVTISVKYADGHELGNLTVVVNPLPKQ